LIADKELCHDIHGRNRIGVQPLHCIFGPRSQHLDRCIQNVAHATFRLEQHRFVRIGLKLATQAQDLHIDAAIEDFLIVHALAASKRSRLGT
jgi:hypothetical protein